MLDFLNWLVCYSVTAFICMCLIISMVQMIDKRLNVKSRLVDCLASTLLLAFLVLWGLFGMKIMLGS